MTEHTDIDRLLESWFDDGPTAMPDRVVTVVADRIGRQGQRHTWLLDRRPKVNLFLKLAVAAALGAAVLGGAIFIAGRQTQTPTPTPIPTPSSSPGASAAAAGSPVDDALRATWKAFAGENPVLQTGAGPVSLQFNPLGTGIEATNFGPGHGYASTANEIGADRIEVVLDRSGGGCTAGARGVYRTLLSDDRSELTLISESEDCSNRGIVLGRAWARSLGDSSLVGAGVVDAIEPAFKVALPDDSYETRTLTDFVEIGGTNGSLMVFKNPQAFVDACSTDQERVPWQPGAAAFIDAFRANDAFEVSESTPLTISGHDAVHVQIGGKADYARCPGQELYEYTPKDCDCHFVVGQGYADSMYLVDVDGDTFMFIISPLGTPESERPIVESIEIPYEIPAR
jgi:hypothetical protein